MMDENSSWNQYKLLVDRLQQNGYIHYEISNFALPGYVSRHNNAYWSGKKYLGAGPSAHSFDGMTRRWNIDKNTSYMKLVNEDSVYYELEELDLTSRFHDYLMTSLRTMWGADMELVLREFGQSYQEYCLQQAKPFLQTGRMKKDGNKLMLSKEGMFLADHIIEALFLSRE